MRGLFAAAAISALVSFAAPVFGQVGTTSTISGVVLDSGRLVVPGADILVRHGSGTNTFGTNINNYEVTTLNGTNTSRQVQIVSRINW
jgi:hypothetical protein